MASKKKGNKVLMRRSSRELKPRGPQDYEQISAAGGMGGGGRGNKPKQQKKPSDQDLLPTVYKSAGIGDSSEPACFFVFNGANGPISGTWAPNECQGDPSVGKIPGEHAHVVPLRLNYKNAHTGEYDTILISRAAISGLGRVSNSVQPFRPYRLLTTGSTRCKPTP